VIQLAGGADSRELDCTRCKRATFHERHERGWACTACGRLNEDPVAEAALQRRKGRGGNQPALGANPASATAASANASDLVLYGEGLERFDRDPAVARFVYQLAALDFEPLELQDWLIGTETLRISLWIDSRGRHITQIQGGWPAGIVRRTTRAVPRGLVLAEVYAISVAGVVHLPCGPELARWKRRLLQEQGALETLEVRLQTLAEGAPESAKSTWKAIESLVSVRWLSDPPEEALTLSVPFLVRWSGIDEQTLRRGKYWLQRHGFITKVGGLPSTPPRRPTDLWKVTLATETDVAASGASEKSHR
jgi:hypothetical protein